MGREASAINHGIEAQSQGGETSISCRSRQEVERKVISGCLSARQPHTAMALGSLRRKRAGETIGQLFTLNLLYCPQHAHARTHAHRPDFHVYQFMPHLLKMLTSHSSEEIKGSIFIVKTQSPRMQWSDALSLVSR